MSCNANTRRCTRCHAPGFAGSLCLRHFEELLAKIERGEEWR